LSKWPFFTIKGALSRGFLRLEVKNVLKIKLNVSPRKSREGNQIIFLKEGLLAIFPLKGRITRDFSTKQRKNLENISPMFSSCNHSHPSDPQPNALKGAMSRITHLEKAGKFFQVCHS